uniref:Uncharacterized protein n=1 Tax=viral metagenome TaxID=1070528 RepID=A0A6C0AVB1_9ZZZZ
MSCNSCNIPKPFKLSSTMFLASQLTRQLSHVHLSSDQDPLFCNGLLKKITVVLYLVVDLLKKTNDENYSSEQKRAIYFKLSIIFRLLKLLREIYNDSIYYNNWKFANYFKNEYPDVYDAIIKKRIDASTAYKWCKNRTKKGADFLKSLVSYITPENFVSWENCIGIDNDEIFIKELVRLIARYQTTAILINSLNIKTIALNKTINEQRERIEDFEAYFRMKEVGGGISRVQFLTRGDFLHSGIQNIQSSFLIVTSVDGKGVGAALGVIDGDIKVMKPGKEYRINEIIQIVYQQVKYFFKVEELAVAEEDAGQFSVATKIDLEKLDVQVPIWTRLYTSLYPKQFNFVVLSQIKKEVLEYGIQYVLLKHGVIGDDVYDQTLTCAF